MEYCDHFGSINYGGHHLIGRERDDSPLHSSEGQEEGEKIQLVCCFCHHPGNYLYLGYLNLGSLYHCVECCNRPVHPYFYENHILKFTKSLENDGSKQVVCWGCGQPVLGTAAYKCSGSENRFAAMLNSYSESECSFVIHESCTKLSYQINHPLHPDHTLSLRPPGPFHCLACCTSHDRAFFYNCDSCDFQFCIKCTNTFPTNPNDCHHHQFFSILRQVQFICDACGKQIKNSAHLCSICKILVHYRCANIPRTFKIKLHNHLLNLTYSSHAIKKTEDMFCRFCGNKVNTEYAAYYCQECNYIFHTECLRGFRNMYGESSTTSELVPNKFIGDTTHLIKAHNQADDEGPHPGEIQHFSHQHKLVLCDANIKDDKLCQVCMEFIILVPFYSCARCDNFFFHTRCAKVPREIEQHRLHNFHPLTLYPGAPICSVKCYICDSYARGFGYICDSCIYRIFICFQCGLIPKTLKHEGHQHSLFFTLDSKDYKKCKACHEDKKKYAFECTDCDFILGIRCANLPLIARHKYDTHFLKLTYVAEDNSREYYCLICEKERDPNHWFYYCVKCDFPAHPECVIWN